MIDIRQKKLSVPAILALIPAVLALLTAAWGGWSYQPFPDAGEYLTLAGNFFGGFEQNTNVPDGWRAPGYPALLSLFYWGLGGYAYLPVNLLCWYFICFIVLNMGREWRLPLWGITLLLSVSAGMLTLSATALSEVPFTLFLLLNIELLRRKFLLHSALMLAIAVLIRPAAMWLWVLEALWAAWQFPKCRRSLIWFVLAANVLTALWCVRNYAIFEHFAFSSHSGRYLLFYKVGHAVAKSNGVPFEEFRFNTMQKLSGDEFEQDTQAQKLATAWITNNFPQFAVAMLSDLPNFLMPDINGFMERIKVISGNRGTLDVLHRSGAAAAWKHYFSNSEPWAVWLTVLYIGGYALTLLFAFAGLMILLWQRRWRTVVPLLLLIGYFWLIPCGNLDWRFRMPVWWVFILLAVYPVSFVSERRRGRHSGEAEQN